MEVHGDRKSVITRTKAKIAKGRAISVISINKVIWIRRACIGLSPRAG